MQRISNCYTTTKVIAVGDNADVGVLAGCVYGKITNCIAGGTASNSTSGNTASLICQIAYSAVVKNCVSTVTGNIYKTLNGSISDCVSVESKTLAEMFSDEYFFNKLFFERDVWKTNGENTPYLAWQEDVKQ